MTEPTGGMEPEIRFKGFGGEWNTTTLGDLGRVATNKRIFMHETASTGDVPFYKIGSFGREPKLFISQRLFEEYKERFPFPEKGDLLFSVIGSIGRVVEYKGEDEYFQDSNVVWLQHNGAVVNSFLKQFYSFVKWSGIEGSTIKHLYNRNILATQIDLPSQTEQTQIGTFFKTLDQMIGLHHRKHDKLVTLKQAMLQKMFPQDGATTPEIRFKGFEEPWEEGELLKGVTRIIDFRGRTPKKLGLDWSANGYLALSAVNVKAGYIDFSVEAHFGDEELYDVWMKGSELHKNQVLFTTEAPMGNVAQVPDNQKYILSQRTIAFEVEPSLLSEDFLAVLLRTPFMFRKLSSLSSGGTAKGVSQKSLASVLSIIPADTTEQQKIGTYFRKLDDLISKHTTQLEKLQNIKSACLEKMFV